MPNQEQLDILKQGVKVWNEWRVKNPGIIIDLGSADLRGADLSAATLRGAALSAAKLDGAILSRAHLDGADLSRAHLSDADLSGAHLDGAYLLGTYLSRAHLDGASLFGAYLYGTYLDGANLSRAHLNDAHLNGAYLDDTIFGNVDLSIVKGLEMVKHLGPSTIGIDTIIRSQGKIPEIFLRNAGVPDSIIEAIPSLVGSLRPIDYYSCFISYSSKNEDFAKRLYADLQSNHVRCWFAPEDMKIGDEIRVRIDESIRVYDKLLIVLSEHSVESTWVEDEVEAALEKERLAREQGERRTVLFPIQLDELLQDVTSGWPAKICRTRHIGNFTSWKDHDEYQQSFARLLRDLQTQ